MALICLSLFLLPVHRSVHANTLPLDISKFSDLNSLVSDSTAKAIVEMVGIAAEHRPYTGAAPLSTSGIGVDIKIEATLVKVTDSFRSALTDAGIDNADSIPDALPIPQLHIQKGVGSRFDFGISAVSYKDYIIWGAHIKFALSVPEEGPIWSLALSYSRSKLGFVKTNTISPLVLYGKKLSFADAYLGAGPQFTSGQLEVPVPIDGIGTLQIEKKAKASAFQLVLGVGLTLGPTGLKIGMGGSYNSKGLHTLGATVGLHF